MRIKFIVLILMGLLSASWIVSGFSEKIDVGPFNANFSVNMKEQANVAINEPLKNKTFTEYGFSLRGNSTKRSIDVKIKDYFNNTDISESELMNSIMESIESKSYDATWDKVSVGGIPAIRAKIRSEPGSSYYSIAFSPDRREYQTGNVTVLVESNFPTDVTDSFLNNLQILRTR
ncbi:MAG: hypothetical protein LUQ22_08650 [Methanotrichaceae archaeon]|nr:hypothetical protein [Methanotrichaceae archaeon]